MLRTITFKTNVWIIMFMFVFSWGFSGCSIFNDLNETEKAALDYALALYSEKQNPERLATLTGRKVTKEGIAHIKPFLKSQGTVQIGSVSSGKNKMDVYLYFSPEMTSGPVLKGFIFKKSGKYWYFQGELKVPDLKKVPFEEFEKSKEFKKIKVENWKEFEMKR
jgi:hypothetical protein